MNFFKFLFGLGAILDVAQGLLLVVLEDMSNGELGYER